MNKIEPMLIEVENSNEFMGIDIKNGEVKIYYPKVLRLSNDIKEKKKELLLFFKSLSLANTSETLGFKSNNDEQYETWPFDSFLWIIRDYKENGYYFNREKKYGNDRNGKIDWKRTLRTLPIISNGNVIYDKLVTSKMSASNDIVAQIYKICLARSIDRMGWFCDLNIIVDVQQVISKNEMIHTITSEYNSTFDDIKRLRYKHMLKILKEIKDEDALNKDQLKCGITNYYYIFERMVDKYFKGISNTERQKYNPKGYWQLNNQKTVDVAPMRPDTIYINGDKLYIIDAKMYKYGFTHNVYDLPNISSINKQITYGDYVCFQDPTYAIRNVFVLPYDKENKDFMKDETLVRFDNDIMAYIGKSCVDWRIKENYVEIYTFVIDFNYLLNNYSKNDDTCVDFLIGTIENEISNKS